MSGLRVLISGASVAGPALAYWLDRAGCTVTIVERTPTLRKEGQGIDVRDSARDVIRRMGIFDAMRDKSSHEAGVSFVDGHNNAFAQFAVDEDSGKGDSLTSDIEILRGELATILYDLTKDSVKYVFGDLVEGLEQTENEVRVSFSNNETPAASFDLVVAADGIGSRIRTMALGSTITNDGDGDGPVRSLDSYVSYFSIPPGETDTMWSRVHWVPGGRCMTLRPDNVGRTRAFLTVTCYDHRDKRLARFAEVVKGGSVTAQKALVQEFFQDAGWEIARILEGMRETQDFYMQHVAQVRLDRWSSGRVAVVGDAGYAPSPFTGMGTSLAFIGAYVLAGEISKQPDNIPAALESYERVLRPYVESVQKLPPGIPWIVNPQSRLGLRLLNTGIWVASILSATGVVSLVSKLAAFLPAWGVQFKLPDYDAFK